MNKMMKKVMVAALACVAFCGVSQAKDVREVKAQPKVKVQLVVMNKSAKVDRCDMKHHAKHDCRADRRRVFDKRRHECHCKCECKRKEVRHPVCKR